MKEIAPYIQLLSSYSVIIPIIIGFLYFRTFDHKSKVLLFYLISVLFIESFAIYLAKNSIHNLFLYYISSFIEFSCFSYVLLNLITHKFKNQIIRVSVMTFGIISIFEFIQNGSNYMNFISRNVEFIFLVPLSIIYFSIEIKKMQQKRITDTFGFWVCTALIIYLSGSFFVFLFSNYLLDESPEILSSIFIIHSLFNVTFSILLAISLTKKSHVS